MNYTSSVQNTSQSVYTPYIIKPGNGNDYVTYADLIKLGNITDFGYKDGYTSFSTWQEFIISVHEHLRDLYERLGGIIPDTVSVTGVTISPPKSQTIYIDSTYQLNATVSPDNASNKSVTWTSTAPAIARVSSSGLVTGVSVGTANITVTTVDGNKKDNATITVQQRNPDPVNVPVTGVSISPESAILTSIGATKQLTVTVLPYNATNKTVAWNSSNQAIATVSTNGLVTAKAAGTVNITVETESGGYMATCAITVSPASQTTYYWYAGTSQPNTSNISTIGTSVTSKPSWPTSNPQSISVTNTTGASSFIYYCFPAQWNVTIYDEDKKSEMTLATDSTFTYNNIEYIVLRQGRKTPNGGTKDFWVSC